MYMEALYPFDRYDLLRSLAALQLVPENADHWVRLAHLTFHAINGSGNGKKRVSRSQLERILNRRMDDHVRMMEDPTEGLFTQAIAGPEGTYLVLPGPTHSPADDLDIIIKAVLSNPFGLNDRFITSVRNGLMALLRMSDTICARAGLQRNQPTSASPHGNVTIPSRDHLSFLKSAITFNRMDLEGLFNGLQLDETFFETFCCNSFGDLTEDFDEAMTHISSHPLVKFGEEYVVASPSAFVNATLNFIISESVTYNCTPLLAKTLHEISAATISNCFVFWGWNRLENSPSRVSHDQKSVISEWFYKCDEELNARVLVCSDALQQYQDWWRPQIEELFEDSSHSQPDIEILIIQTSGRFSLVSCDGPKETLFLPISTSDLQIVFETERTNPLVLIQFARHSDALRSRCQIASTHTLDEYALYLQHGHSFYVGDSVLPNQISLMGDIGGELRCKTLSRRDRHAVRSPSGADVIEVQRLYADVAMPSYITFEGKGLLSEAYDVPIWITSPFQTWERRSPEFANISFVHHVVSEAIAYWLWQFASDLRPVMSPLAKIYTQLLVQIVLTDENSWSRAIDGEIDGDPDQWIQAATHPALGHVRIFLTGKALSAFLSSDNVSERQLMAAVLIAFRSLLPLQQQRIFSDSKIRAVLDSHAPIGVKKMIIAVDARASHELYPTSGPAHRPIQQAETAFVLDELGRHLESTIGLHVGPIPDSVVQDVLNNGVVHFLYRALVSDVAQLTSVGLLEWLVQRHESLLAEMARNKLETIPRLACYGSDLEETIRTESQMLSNSDMAMRFLIELVTSNPPSGTLQLSLSRFDRILALAYEIIYYGMESDLHKYRLSNAKFAILPSGRLGQARQEFTKFQEAFFARIWSGQVKSFAQSFHRYWHRSVTDKRPAFIEDADPAIRSEFNLSLTQIVDGISVLVTRALEVECGVARIKRESVVNILREELDWKSEDAELFIATWSMNPREDFLRPSEPYKSFDVWPWRFNRRLSYLRRPLLCTSSEPGGELIWSARNLQRAGSYFLDLLLDGRLPAHSVKQSREMSIFQSKLNNARGYAFEGRVHQPFDDLDRFAIKTRVKRVGGKAVGAIGEIDAIVLDRQNRRAFVLECKDLLFAKTPYEMRQQLDEVQNSDPTRKTAVSQAATKAAWVEDCIPALLQDCKLDPSDAWRWKVQPVVVLDHDMFATLIQGFEIPVISYALLVEFVSGSKRSEP